jgi:uncharacterized protein
VKRYADEEDAERVRGWRVLVVAALSRVEVPAALWRKQRMGELAPEEARLLVADFEADWYGTPTEPSTFIVVDARGPVLDAAARLAAVHGLRAYDAVQLASALAARDADPGCDTVLVYDTALRRASAAEGLRPDPS